MKIVERPAFLVVGMSIETKPMSPDIPALWPRFAAREHEIDNPLEPPVTYGVMHHAAGSMEVLHYLASLAVLAVNRLPPGMVCLAIPGGSYAAFRYPLSGIAKGFHEIFSRLLPQSPYTQAPGPYFERYDENFDPANPDSLVEICIPVRR